MANAVATTSRGRRACAASRARTFWSPAAARDRPGDRGSLRGVRRQRGDQLPAPARGGRGYRGAGPGLRRGGAAHGVKDVLVQGDVSNEDDVVRMVAAAVEGLGGIDVLVNNAGIQISRPREELSSDDFDRVLAVNLRGAFMCAREAIATTSQTTSPARS